MAETADSFAVPVERKPSPVGPSCPRRRSSLPLSPLRPGTDDDDPDPDGLDEISQEESPKKPFVAPPLRWQHSMVEKWCQERNVTSQQVVGVLRHTERADASWALVDNTFWHRTKDFELWPLDPPLSDNGVKAAQQIGQQVRQWVWEAGAELHIVVSSPFLRCVQTAVEVCAALGPGTRLLIDRSLSEIYGTCAMPGLECQSEAEIVRPIEHFLAVCERLNVHCVHECVGRWPSWPEDLRSARRRFATRYLTYVRRSVRVRRNFLIVSHADCVGAALSMMPSEATSIVEKVDYGGLFLARRELQATLTRSKPRKRLSCPGRLEASPKQAEAVNPFTSEGSMDSDADPTAEGPTPYSSELSDFCVDNDCKMTRCNSHNSEDSPLCPSRQFRNSKADYSSAPSTVPEEWHVESFGIVQQSSEDKRSAILQRRLNEVLKDGCFSRRMVEKLLFQSLSENPLGVEDATVDAGDADVDTGWTGVEFRSLSLSRTASFTNSTLVFGMSSGNLERLSQVPSRAVTLNSLESVIDETGHCSDTNIKQDGDCTKKPVQLARSKAVAIFDDSKDQDRSPKRFHRSATRTLSYDLCEPKLGDEHHEAFRLNEHIEKTARDKPCLDSRHICLKSSSNSRIARRRSSERLNAASIGMPPLFYAARTPAD